MAHETCAEVSGVRLAQIFPVRRLRISEGQLARPRESSAGRHFSILTLTQAALVCPRVLMPFGKEPKSGRQRSQIHHLGQRHSQTGLDGYHDTPSSTDSTSHPDSFLTRRVQRLSVF